MDASAATLPPGLNAIKSALAAQRPVVTKIQAVTRGGEE
jgi:hypothetical protein